MNGDEGRRYKAPPPPPGARGALARQQLAQIVIRSKAKGVEDEPAPSPLILLLFTKGLDPFEQLAVVIVSAKHFRCRQGQRGARRTTLALSLFWIWRNARAGGPFQSYAAIFCPKKSINLYWMVAKLYSLPC